MKKQFLEVGEIVTTHGIHGMVKVRSWCDSPNFILQFSNLYFDPNGKDLAEVTDGFVHKDFAVLKLRGVDIPDVAALLVGKVLYMDRREAELPPGVHFIQDMIGLEVVDGRSGEVLGSLHEVLDYPASQIYAVQTPSGREVLVPAVPEMVDRIDEENGRIYLTPVAGLFDE